MDGTTRSELGKLRLADLVRDGLDARRATARLRHTRRPEPRGEPAAER